MWLIELAVLAGMFAGFFVVCWCADKQYGRNYLVNKRRASQPRTLNNLFGVEK